MRIGILTFHRAHNYGAVLQCYALQETLKGMGHDAWVIDYRQPHIERAYKPFIWRRWLSNIIHVRKDAFYYLKGFPQRVRRKRNFEAFMARYYHLTQPCSKDSIPVDFDCYVIGSDQLWNWQCVGNEIEKVYLGNFPHSANSQIVGYAISAKMGALDSLGMDLLNRSLDNFSAMSMREEIIAKVAGCLTGRKIDVCCDPTLLNDGSFWDKLTNERFKDRKYVLMYEVRKPKGQPHYLRSKVETLAGKLGCEVIDASSGEYSVEDFVSLFKYAKYVVTTSFHATVFALTFERPLYSVMLRDGCDERYVNLLHTVGADNFCVEMDFDAAPLETFDYDTIKAGLRKYRTRSLDFLENSVRGG